MPFMHNHRILAIFFILLVCPGWTFVLAEKPGSTELVEGLNRRDQMQYVEAAKYFTLAAEHATDDAAKGQALAELGKLYAEGNGVAKDEAKATKLIEQAATLGDRGATLELGKVYLARGNITKAKTLLTSVQDSSPEALTLLAGLEKNPEQKALLEQRALLGYRKSAEQGNASAMRVLGMAYAEGRLVPKNLELAEQWYRKAIEAGDVASVMKLARLWAEDGKHSAVALFQLYLQAAEHEVSEARYRVAFAYHTGVGTAKDKTKAGFWLKEALKEPSPWVKKLAKDYEAADAKRAATVREWYQLAAKLGDKDSMLWLAEASASGSGVSPNMETAYQWYRKAAEAGSGEGQYQLGLGYARGLGVAQDRKQAIHWLKLAEKNGYPYALETLESLPAESSTTNEP